MNGTESEEQKRKEIDAAWGLARPAADENERARQINRAYEDVTMIPQQVSRFHDTRSLSDFNVSPVRKLSRGKRLSGMLQP